MSNLEKERANLQNAIDNIIRKIQTIQLDIRASRQPASKLELERLKDLGYEYAHIIIQLEQLNNEK